MREPNAVDFWRGVALVTIDAAGENTIVVAKALALAGLDLLTDAQLLEQVQAEFKQERSARKS